VVYIIKGDRWGLCLYEKLCHTINPEIIIRSFSYLRGKLYNDIPLVGRLLGLVFYIPAKGIEKRIDKIYSYPRDSPLRDNGFCLFRILRLMTEVFL